MKALRPLLVELNSSASDERAEVEARIWERFGTERAVFVLDMAGFSLLTQKRGIVHYMAMVENMRATVEPMLKDRRGHLVKFEADNCFAVFDTTTQAIDMAIAVNRWFESINLVKKDDDDIHLSIGIDFGRLLLLDDDLWGNPVNLSSKLGEDLAEKGEILVTQGAWDGVKDQTRYKTAPAEYNISGLELKVQRILY